MSESIRPPIPAGAWPAPDPTHRLPDGKSAEWWGIWWQELEIIRGGAQ